jgi:hypothetical protein
MELCFAVVADGEEQPAAVFQTLEDALDWALFRLGSDNFRVRHLRLVPLDRGMAVAGGGQTS